MAETSQSSHLQSYEYDFGSETLTVTFQNGSVYTYTGVPVSIYQELRNSGGGGTLFWSRIRNKYPTNKVYDPKAQQ